MWSISLLILLTSCSQNKGEQSEKKEKQPKLLPQIEIGASKEKNIAALESQGYQLNDDKLTKTKKEIHQTVQMYGDQKVIGWKSRWEGDLEIINSFTKRLLNVLKTDYTNLKGANGYYACRYHHENEEMILELIIWENKVELIHRKGH